MLISCHLQLRNFSVDCARELFKPSKDSANLLVSNDKKLLVLGFRFFLSDVISEVGFWSFWLIQKHVRSMQYQFRVFKNMDCFMSLHRRYLDETARPLRGKICAGTRPVLGPLTHY